MLNEPSILSSGQAAPQAEPESLSAVSTEDVFKASVVAVMDIQQIDYQPAPPATVSYTGRLLIDSETAYAQLDEKFATEDHHVVLTLNPEGQHVIIALKGRIRPKDRPRWPNLVLLLLTILSLLYVGAAQEAGMHDSTDIELWRGWPYALSLLLILGSHELGHYFAARYHHVNVTLPYFIPLPFGFFGTLGAFIQLREPMRNRKILFDIGVAGPLAGLIVAVPILLIGLATSDLEPLPTEDYILEGNSLTYAVSKFAIFGEWLPTGTKDVFINQLAKAGWTGLMITGLNLIPLGQLDGGHVVFTLLGRKVQYLYLPVVSIFLLLAFYNAMWFPWTLLLFFFGRVYAVPLDTVTPLDSRRRWLGYAALVIFVLVFVPNPLQIVQR
ncbi:MAG: site-2 protease family protein [Chloroflexi bacterium]|nr:site-2 protease family protein [Chloroflexota bacterium]